MRERKMGLLGMVLFLGIPTLAMGQEVTVPSSDLEWEALRSRLEQNPYILALADRENALAVIVKALRTRGDGLLWGAYGPVICVVQGRDRAQLSGDRRREAFRGSRECFERILGELPASTDEPGAEMVRGMLVRPLAEALIEVGDLEGADSIAKGELQRPARGEAGMDGNTQYLMNQVRGRVALRRQQTEAAMEFLQRAGRSRGSPQLSSFGPRFALARELLQVGERDAVLQHLDAVERFWTGPGAEEALAEARRVIRAGGVPDDVRWR